MRPGDRGRTGLAALCVLLALTACSIASDSADGPRVNLDHWHAAYGVYDCDLGWLPAFASTDDPVGIHSHGDGLIYIHPFEDKAAGQNATMGHFFDSMRIRVHPARVGLDDGSVLAVGEPCPGSVEPSNVRILQWHDADNARAGKGPDVVYHENFERILLDRDRAGFAIVRTAPDAEVPPLPAARFDALNAFGAST